MVNNVNNLTTIVLAGGFGTRLGDLTKSIPKPMVNIKGKPFLYYQLEYLKRQGLDNFILCVSYLHEKIIDYFQDGANFGYKIKYSIEETPLGTGGAIKEALILNNISNPFFVINGDTFVYFDPNSFLYSFILRDTDALIGISEGNKYDTSSIIIDNYNRIISYIEKSPNYENDILNGTYSGAGVYLFHKKLFECIPKKEFSLEEEFIPMLFKRDKNVFAKKINNYYDMGTKQGLNNVINIL